MRKQWENRTRGEKKGKMLMRKQMKNEHEETILKCTTREQFINVHEKTAHKCTRENNAHEKIAHKCT